MYQQASYYPPHNYSVYFILHKQEHVLQENFNRAYIVGIDGYFM